MIDLKDLQKPSQMKKKKGKFILIYGDGDVGKTHSTLASLPRPILYLWSESKADAEEIINDKLKIPDSDLSYYQYKDTDVEDFLEFLFTSSMFDGFNSVFLDGYSHLMKVKFMQQITEQSHGKRKQDGKVGIKTLTSLMKTNVEDHGTVNNTTKRIFTALGNRALDGKVVVMSMHDAEQVRWGDQFVIGPDFSGKEIPGIFRTFFDMIGYVTPRFEAGDDGKVKRDANGFPIKVFPPLVRFQSDGTFIARGGGIGPLDFSKILKLDKKGGK